MSSFIKANWLLSTALTAMAIISVAAVAQTSSPFASKKKKQAWETDAVRPAPSSPAYQAPAYQAPTYQAPSYQVPSYTPPPAYGSSTAPVTQPSHQTMPAARVAVPPGPSYSAPRASQTTSAYRSSVQTAPTSTASSAPSYGSSQAYQAQPTATYQPSYSQPSRSQQSYSQPSSGSAAPQQSHPQQSYNAPQAKPYSAPQNSAVYRPQRPVPEAVPQELLPGYRPAPTGAYYPGRADKGGFSVSAQAPRGQQYPSARAPSQQTYSGANNTYGQNTYSQNGYGQNGYGQNTQSQPRTQNAYAPKRSWGERLGLGNLATTFRGFLKLGAAALNRKNMAEEESWDSAFVADAMVAGEVSAITQGGLEYGVGAELRGQYDKYRRGFGGLVGNCGTGAVAGVQGCNSVVIDGTVRPLRGHSSQFYSAGVNNAKAGEYAVEGAYVFLRSAYGDFTVGRDDGAAYLFSLGAPTLLAVNASNSPVDYTGLDSVKTVNDASGFAEKLAYVSPRLLGDQIGVGVQFGASYAPNARACGVDYCVRSNGRDGSTALSPDLKDVVEFGVALDRKFSNGLSLEATASYASASEESGIAGFDDLQSFGLGLESKFGPWTLGGSYLNSNNGLTDGDYEAYDIGLTWKPSRFGISLAYGHAKDENVNLSSDQATLGFVYDFDRFTLGTGVQYIDRSVTNVAAGIAAPRREKGAAVFVEGGVKF